MKIFTSCTLAIAITVALSSSQALASDKLNRQQLIDAAKQIGQTDDYEAFEAALVGDNTKAVEPSLAPTDEATGAQSSAPISQEEASVPTSTPPLGLPPTEQAMRQRLSRYGKQKLIIDHEQTKRLQSAAKDVATMFTIVPERESGIDNTTGEPPLVEPTPPVPATPPSAGSQAPVKTPSLTGITPPNSQDSLAESVSALKALFIEPTTPEPPSAER